MKFKTLKDLKQLQANLGGASKGYYIAVYGHDVKTGKTVSGTDLGYWSSPIRSGSYHLVKGKLVK